jgi:hypothetical protein
MFGVRLRQTRTATVMQTHTHLTAAAAAARKAAQEIKQPPFPDVTWQKNRGYIRQSALDIYRAELVAASLGVEPVMPPTPNPDPLIPLKQVAANLGYGRRTLGRRIVESRRAAEQAIAAE